VFLISLNSVKTGIRCSVEISLIPQKDKQHHWKTMASLFLHLSYFKASKKVKTGIKCSIEVPLTPHHRKGTQICVLSGFLLTIVIVNHIDKTGCLVQFGCSIFFSVKNDFFRKYQNYKLSFLADRHIPLVGIKVVKAC